MFCSISDRKDPLEPAQSVVHFGAIDDAFERLRVTIPLQVALFRRAPEAIGRKLNDDMTLRLHDLIQRVLLRGPKEHLHLSFGGPSPDVGQQRFVTIREPHRNIVHPVEQAARIDVSEDTSVLRNSLWRAQDRVDYQLLEHRPHLPQ